MLLWKSGHKKSNKGFVSRLLTAHCSPIFRMHHFSCRLWNGVRGLAQLSQLLFWFLPSKQRLNYWNSIVLIQISIQNISCWPRFCCCCFFCLRMWCLSRPWRIAVVYLLWKKILGLELCSSSTLLINLVLLNPWGLTNNYFCSGVWQTLLPSWPSAI